MRKQEDGSIYFPERGEPPKPAEGFIVDPTDPFHHIPKSKEVKNVGKVTTGRVNSVPNEGPTAEST